MTFARISMGRMTMAVAFASVAIAVGVVSADFSPPDDTAIAPEVDLSDDSPSNVTVDKSPSTHDLTAETGPDFAAAAGPSTTAATDGGSAAETAWIDPPWIDVAPDYEFVAFNDLAWADGQSERRITKYTSPNGAHDLASSGGLVDSFTGAPTGVDLTIQGGSYDSGHATEWSAPAPAGSDAASVFTGNVDTLGSISYLNEASPAGHLVLTLDGLDPSKRYTIVAFGNRDAYGWTRSAQLAIGGAAAYVNKAGEATDDTGAPISSGPADSSTRLPAGNDAGLVARYEGVHSGDDGTVTLTLSDDNAADQEYRGKYLNALMVAAEGVGSTAPSIDRVVVIGVDGLRADAINDIDEDLLPNFARVSSGAFTANARTNSDSTVTLPNHVSIITGRPANGEFGHDWTSNSDPPDGVTLHSNHGSYVPSLFDAAHDSGFDTSLFASKSKFSIFDNSYDDTSGAPDAVGVDDIGSGTGHGTASDPANYTIPLGIWLCDGQPAVDMYALASDRVDPGSTNPSDPPGGAQPLRNADVANIVTALTGLPRVDASVFDIDEAVGQLLSTPNLCR